MLISRHLIRQCFYFLRNPQIIPRVSNKRPPSLHLGGRVKYRLFNYSKVFHGIRNSFLHSLVKYSSTFSPFAVAVAARE